MNSRYDVLIIGGGKAGLSLARHLLLYTDKTVLVVEAGDESAVIWTKPDDFEWQEKDPAKGLSQHEKSFLAVFCDGHIQTVSRMADPKILKAIFTRNGGENVNENELAP